MADEKEPLSDADALEELYASALSDIHDDSMSDFDMGDIPIEEILEASDNVEMPSFDAYSEALGTNELDELLEKENVESNAKPKKNAIIVEGAIDSGFSIEDVDLETMSLSDLMIEDDDISFGEDELEESSEVEEIPEVEDMSLEVSESEKSEESEIIRTTPEAIEEAEEIETEINIDDMSPDDLLAEVFGEKEEDTFELDEDTVSFEDILNTDTDDSDESDKESVISLDEGLELEVIDEDELEELESEVTIDPSMLKDGKPKKKAKKQTYVEVNTSNINTENVFEEPLSVLNDDVDESEVGVDDVESLLDSVKIDSTQKKKTKKSFGSLFANIVDDKEIKKVEQEKKAAAQAEIDKQKKAELKKVKDEQKAQKKEEKKLENARKAEEKKAAREAKKRARKEAKEFLELEEESEIEGRINKAGAVIVFLILGFMAASIFFGTKIFSYNNSISNAKQYFENGQYEESYNELVGLDLKEEDKLLYEKVVTIMQVYKQLDAYEMYYKEGRYPQALDALLKGVREYEKNIAKATELDITANMDELKEKIVHELSVEYGITEEIAREVNQITDSKVYSMRVYELAKELASDYY